MEKRINKIEKSVIIIGSKFGDTRFNLYFRSFRNISSHGNVSNIMVALREYFDDRSNELDSYLIASSTIDNTTTSDEFKVITDYILKMVNYDVDCGKFGTHENLDKSALRLKYFECLMLPLLSKYCAVAGKEIREEFVNVVLYAAENSEIALSRDTIVEIIITMNALNGGELTAEEVTEIRDRTMLLYYKLDCGCMETHMAWINKAISNLYAKFTEDEALEVSENA